MIRTIEGIKLIKHNLGGINDPDDPSFGPWRLDMSLRPPEFMKVASICMYGGNEVVMIRGKTREALEEFVELNQLRTHPRLVRLTIEQKN